MPQTVRARPSFRKLALLALPALALAGCGLADYEKKMMDADAHVQRFDEENRLLGDPLTLPTAGRTNADGPTVEVFFRPPKGVTTKHNTQQGELPYHYQATSGVCTDVYLTFGNSDDGRDTLEKVIEALLGAAAQNWQSVEVHPFGRAPLPFDAVEFYDPRAPANTPALYIAYVHKSPGWAPVGVVFRVLQSNRSVADPAVKLSLETYADAGDASTARKEYGKRAGP